MSWTRWESRAGTPSHLETKQFDSETLARNWLTNKIGPRMKWAEKFNLEAKADLDRVRLEISNLITTGMPKGDKRRWEVVDDVSRVRFVYEIERIE